MEKLILSLYVGSLFLILTSVAPVLLRTEENKDLAGRFYGKILWRFYRIAFLLLVVYLILGELWKGALLLIGLSLNVYISNRLRKYKRMLGNIEHYDFNSPERTRFRKMSYLSTALLGVNLLIAMSIFLGSSEC